MTDHPIFFDGWQSLLSILVTAPCVFALVVLAVKVSGKRSMSQLNNFDWVVTVAMGAIGASSIILDSVTVLDAAVAIGTLLVLQVGVTYVTSRSQWAEGLLKSDPVLLVDNGRFLKKQLLKHRLSEGDVRSVLRGSGYSSLSEIRWVIFEADARVSIIPKSSKGEGTNTMVDVFDRKAGAAPAA